MAGSKLKDITVFKKRDIEHGSRKHKFELVVCDHVLQYYSAEEQMKLVHSLANAVVKDGYMYISSPINNVLDQISRRLSFKRLGRCFFQRK